MSRILTVTPNTAIDFRIELDRLNPGATMMAKNCVEYAAGKGINVARAIESLRYPVMALGFLGCQSLTQFEAIRSDLLQPDFTLVEGRTRSNMTLVDMDKHEETHIRTIGFTVTSDDCNKLAEKIEQQVRANDIVVLSGSLPPGAPNNFYRVLIGRCHNKGARTFLDSSGQSLAQGLSAQPYLIKLNHKEFEELMNRPLLDENAIVTAARNIIDQGIQWVVVSWGEQGVIVVSDTLAVSAEVNCLSEKPISTIGCGDALVAGLAVADFDSKPLSDGVKFAVCCATANLFSPEPGRIDPALVERLNRHIVFRGL